jgi:low temperature requirement protein LtrA
MPRDPAALHPSPARTPAEEIKRVTTLELFFGLVFVATIPLGGFSAMLQLLTLVLLLVAALMAEASRPETAARPVGAKAEPA